MNIFDVINKTRFRKPLSDEEISFLVNGFVDGNVESYQMSAWLMAVCLNSLSDEETASLTIAMMNSGKRLDLSGIEGITVDKHSTGGIGDKTSLIIAPICAACGIKVPKMSGRGLGYTGGTIDKLASIPGYSTSLGFDAFVKTVNKCGFSIVSQSTELCPADKKMYALRDVTATVESIPLICSSIMSKKLAMGADCILLDVKCGNGAFMKDRPQAEKLCVAMERVGAMAGKRTRAVISDMNEPLGCSVGNSLEVIEAIETLKGEKKGRLYDECLMLSSEMLAMARSTEAVTCVPEVAEAVESGRALEMLRKNIELQGGEPEVIDNYRLFPQPRYSSVLYSEKSGTVRSISAIGVGMASHSLGAGRTRTDGEVDLSAGIRLCCQSGDRLEKGEPLAELYSSTVADMSAVAAKLNKCVEII